jgi:hypothetical protein
MTVLPDIVTKLSMSRRARAPAGKQFVGHPGVSVLRQTDTPGQGEGIKV